MLVRGYGLSKNLCGILTKFLSTATSGATQPKRDPVQDDHILSWQIHSYGGIEELQLSKSRAPIIKSPDEVIVEVSGSSVNPIDLAVMGNYGSVVLNLLRQAEACTLNPTIEFPLTLGRDFAGTVVAKGHGVRGLRLGDEVWGVVPPHKQGSHACQVIVSESNVHKKPRTLGMVEAASLPYTAMTAWSALRVTGDLALLPPRGKKVLVLGAAGGVGSAAVQMLQAWGAHVVATASGSGLALLEGMSVPLVVDYTAQDAMQQLAEEGKYDIILDCAGLGMDGGAPYLPLLADYSLAKYVTLKSPFLRNVDQWGVALGMARNVAELVAANVGSGLVTKSSSVRWAFFMPLPQALQEVTHLAEAGKLTPVIDTVYPFDQLPEAFRRVAAGHLRGKVAIEMTCDVSETKPTDSKVV